MIASQGAGGGAENEWEGEKGEEGDGHVLDGSDLGDLALSTSLAEMNLSAMLRKYDPPAPAAVDVPEETRRFFGFELALCGVVGTVSQCELFFALLSSSSLPNNSATLTPSPLSPPLNHNNHRYLTEVMETTKSEELSFSQMFQPRRTKRSVAAQAFSHVLALSSAGFLRPQQGFQEPDIRISLASAMAVVEVDSR